MKTLTLVRCQRLSQHNFYQRQLFLSLTPGERMSDYKVVPLSNLLHLHSLQASSRKHFRDQLIFYIETLLLFFPNWYPLPANAAVIWLSNQFAKNCNWQFHFGISVWPPDTAAASVRGAKCLFELFHWVSGLQERSCASKCPFLCFLRRIVCKIPTPTIDKAASKTCLKKKGHSSVAGNTLSRLDLTQAQQWGKAFFPAVTILAESTGQ